MTDRSPAGHNICIALLHYPVYDKNRQIVTTAVTNLDIHDIARAAKTFGLGRYYIVTPVEEQIKLVERVRAHWLEGWGATYNPKRRQALELLTLSTGLDEVVADMENRYGSPPRLVMTGAKNRPDSTSCDRFTQDLRDPQQCWLLVFGTGWGLTEEVMTRADLILEPIRGQGEYNHLSVRSAVSILLDRLLGDRQAIYYKK